MNNNNEYKFFEMEKEQKKPFSKSFTGKIFEGRDDDEIFFRDFHRNDDVFSEKMELLVEISEWLEETTIKDFYDEIQKKIIGQEELQYVVTNVYNYLQNISRSAPVNNNMIISAPSGCGKTETYRVLKDYFAEKIPTLEVYIVDVSQITSTGFKGLDASSILNPFFQNKIEDAIGIVFLDEFDKKIMPIYDSNGMNVNKEVQGNMLTIIEGTAVEGKDPGNRQMKVHTENLMFVGIGSFDYFREDKVHTANPIGLGAQDLWNEKEENEDRFCRIEREDMIEAGAINEFIGRFPYIVNYHKLSDEAIASIIEMAVERVKNSFALNGLILTDEYRDVLFAQANSKFGCRLIDATLKSAVLKGYSKCNLEHPDRILSSLMILGDESVEPIWEEDDEEAEWVC